MIPLNLITANLCTQILAFQQTIAIREADQQFPTPQEVNLQCKLINCLVKLTGLAAKNRMPDEEDVEEAIKYGQQTTVGSTIPDTTSYVHTESPAPTQREHRDNTPPPPFSRTDFETHKHLIFNYDIPEETTLLNGKEVYKPWLEYNLLQYYLPIQQRYFISDETDYRNTINHSNTLIDIRILMHDLEPKNNAA
jgi:hypothetical protein